MTTVERSTRIAAPIEAVWAVLADFDSISAWAGFVDHACLTSDRSDGVGMARRIQTGRTTVIETVTAWEPPHELSYAISGLPPVIKSVTNTWSLADAAGSTTARLVSEIDAGHRPPQRLVAKAVGRKLGQSSDEMLAGLKACVETSRR